MARCLVTGGAGFIGSHVAEELLKAGHEVVVLDDLSGGFHENVPVGARLIIASILDNQVGQLTNFFTYFKFDHVFHLGAYAAEGLSHFIRRYNYENNLIGSINLINESVKHGVKTFVFTSSMAVYGSEDPPFTEGMWCDPEDPYGIAKLAVEQDLQCAHEMFGLEYIVFRPHNVYGERQHIGDQYRNVIGIFMNQIMRGEPMTIFGDGEQTRAFSHISDVAPTIARSIDVPEARNQTFNIGGDVPYTINQLSEAVSVAMGQVDRMIINLPPRIEVREAFCDHSKAREIFGTRDLMPLDKGLASMAEWAKSRGPMEPTRFSEIELTKNLPEKWAL